MALLYRPLLLSKGKMRFLTSRPEKKQMNILEPHSASVIRSVRSIKKKKDGRRKSQKRYISPPCGGAIPQPICTKFGEFVDLTDSPNLVQVGCEMAPPRGGETFFSRLFLFFPFPWPAHRLQFWSDLHA